MKYFLLSLICLISIIQTTYGQQLTLDDLISSAESSNPSLQASLAQYHAMKARAGQSGYLDDPMIGGGFFIQPVETRVGPQVATVSVSQMFPWFGTLDARERSMDLMAEAAYEEYIDKRNKVSFDVTAAYSNMYAVTKSIEAVRGHITWLAAFKDILTVRYENGRAGLSDVLRIEMELQTMQSRTDAFYEKLATLNASLEELTGDPGISGIVFPDTLALAVVPDELEGILQAVRSRNPRIRKYDRLKESYEQSERAVAKMGLPSFTIGATYTFIDPREDVTMTGNGKDAIIFPQLGLRLPLYRGKYDAMKEEALQQQAAADAGREASTLRLATDAAAALEKLRNARRDVELYRGLSNLSARTRDIVIEEYTTAGSSIDNVIQVERQYIDYQLKLEHARAAFNTGAAEIDYLTGTRGLNNE